MPWEKDFIRDQLLALRCRRGDRTAWKDLINAWQPRLFYYIRRLVRGEEDAWDALQQTWIAVYEGMDRLTDSRHLAAWLYRIARNKAIDQRRRIGSFDDFDNDDGEQMIDEKAPCSLDNVEMVHFALDELSLAHREVLTLYFLQDISVAQIAEILCLPEGTVKSRLHHAKRQLRIKLEHEVSP